MTQYIIGDIFKGDYPISQFYGNNKDYYSQFGFNGHEGVDWATPTGVEILAPFKRNIILQDQDDPKSGAYGTYIVVWDPEQKCAIWYCHLSVNSVEFDKEYPKGTVLGKTGNSGNTSDPHIHVNFVETDVNGVRQNQDNGFKGMLNILDPNLVKWSLGEQPQPIPTQPNGTITIASTQFEELVGKSTKYDAFVSGGFDSIDQVKVELKKQQDTIDNLNNQIKKLHSDASTKDTTISNLTSQVTDLSKEIERLSNQANLNSETQDLYTQLQHDYTADKLAWAESNKRTNYEIAAYKNTSYKTVGYGVLISEILRRFFHLNT